MELTQEMTEYVSILSKLRLPEAEQEKMTQELAQIVSYMDILNTLDTSEVEPLSHIFPIKNVMRPDEVVPSYPREDLLKNAPKRDKEAFLVPKTVE